MPLFTRNAIKKQKLESSSSQDSRKLPQKRMRMTRGQGAQVQESADMSADAHQASKLADARAPTEVETRAPPLAPTAISLTSASSSTTPMAFLAKPLKGHKRFNADLRDLNTGCSSELNRGTWSAQSFRAGEDDGSVEFELVDSRDQTRIAVHVLCSDTSEYPKSHSFFCHSPDPGSYAEQMKEICDGVLNIRPSTIREVVKHVLIKISCDDEDDEDDDEDHHDDIGIVSVKPEAFRSILRRDFEGTYAAGYTPGIVGSDSGEFLLTVSIPVVELTEIIPAHVLMSWDSQFLLPRQHLVLVISGFRGVYPPIRVDGTLTNAALCSGTSLKFNVGFSQQYKPSKERVAASLRQFGLQFNGGLIEDYIDVDEEHDNINGTFDKLSLSSSFESLLDEHFLSLLRLRQQFNLGWAAAEELRWRSQELQKSPAILVTEMQEVLCQADDEERCLVAPRHLPHDPLERQDDHINFLETAFAYFLRRLTLCSRYCAVCHKKIDSHFEALKPYVCNSGLCAYQYYSLNFGPSLEYDICKNTEMVDLLVSLAYTAAATGVLDEPLPRGLSLMVPNTVNGKLVDNSLRDFDSLSINDMRTSIRDLIDSLPLIEDMKNHLEKRVPTGTIAPKLKDMDPNILPAAWSILRWCVASCTAHLQELTEEEDRVQNIGPEWRQFRFTVGAPDKEAKFRYALEKETPRDVHAKQYPTLYAFHGSPLSNWHSIIRHGLWYKTIANGRAYGNGVYFAMDGSTSTGYAVAGPRGWKNSTTNPSVCVALAEIINLPHRFTSSSPHYVVQNTDWIMCRYLLVKTYDGQSKLRPASSDKPNTTSKEPLNVPFMAHDSRRQPLLGGMKVDIPQPSYKLQKLLALCKESYVPPDLDEEDKAVFNAPMEV